MALGRTVQLRYGGLTALVFVTGLILGHLYTGVVPGHWFAGLSPSLWSYSLAAGIASGTGWITGALADDLETGEGLFHSGFMALLLLLVISALWRGGVLARADSAVFALRFMTLGAAAG